MPTDGWRSLNAIRFANLTEYLIYVRANNGHETRLSLSAFVPAGRFGYVVPPEVADELNALSEAAEERTILYARRAEGVTWP